MSASPDSARPATRRALRERNPARNRARAGADGDPGPDAETPTDAAAVDAATAVLTPAGSAAGAARMPDAGRQDAPVIDAADVPAFADADAVSQPHAPSAAAIAPEIDDADAAALGLETAETADAELAELVTSGLVEPSAADELPPGLAVDADTPAAEDADDADDLGEPGTADDDSADLAADAADDVDAVDAVPDDVMPETAFLLSKTDPLPTALPVAQEPVPETEFLTDEVPDVPEVVPEAGAEVAPASAPAEWADERRPPTALTWIDTRAIEAASAAHTVEEEPAPDVLAGAKLTPGWLRPRVLVPFGIVAALCGAYVATTLLWPLNAVAPEVTATQVEVAPAPAAAVTWPGAGSAAVGVEGLPAAASTTSADEIASISKVASVLMVLDELPLKPGEQGPSFAFDRGDSRDYWQYRRENQSSLDVPVGGSLTEYQMLQGVMLGSANNYIDRLADELWGGRRGFAEASRVWLRDHGISGMTLESPSGFDERNVATPAALVQLGELAMKNPVFAEIVGTRTAEIPGAGKVTNTNGMLADKGVIGIKTGTLSHWNLLTAKEVPVGDTTVRLFAAVLGQDDNKARLAVTRSLLAEVEKQLAEQPVSVPAGTVVGHVSTEWGDRVDVVTDADTRVVLWNGAAATASTEFSLGAKTKAGATVGTLTTDGPIDSAETSVSLKTDVPAPSIWWRLTHPLELFGLDKN